MMEAEATMEEIMETCDDLAKKILKTGETATVHEQLARIYPAGVMLTDHQCLVCQEMILSYERNQL